jgi:hypothetical protein
LNLDALREAMEAEAEIALAANDAAGWVIGAINPCELAYFAAVCRVSGVRRIVESGRQDGYSTRILGRLAERTGITVVSIDMEIDQARADACRARLAGLPLELLKADAYRAVGEEIAKSAQPTALLIDGPKGFPALALLLAASRFEHVRVLALHNLSAGRPWLPFFRTLGATARMYEDVSGWNSLPAWNKLRAAEYEKFDQLLGRDAVPSVSSLGVLSLPAERPLPAFAQPFNCHQPAVLAALWRLGAHAVARRLFVASFHVFGNK